MPHRSGFPTTTTTTTTCLFTWYHGYPVPYIHAIFTPFSRSCVHIRKCAHFSLIALSVPFSYAFPIFLIVVYW